MKETAHSRVIRLNPVSPGDKLYIPPDSIWNQPAVSEGDLAKVRSLAEDGGICTVQSVHYYSVKDAAARWFVTFEEEPNIKYNLIYVLLLQDTLNKLYGAAVYPSAPYATAAVGG